MNYKILQKKEIYFYDGVNNIPNNNYIKTKKICFEVRLFLDRSLPSGILMVSEDGKYILESNWEGSVNNVGYCDLEFYAVNFSEILEDEIKFRFEYPKSIKKIEFKFLKVRREVSELPIRYNSEINIVARGEEVFVDVRVWGPSGVIVPAGTLTSESGKYVLEYLGGNFIGSCGYVDIECLPRSDIEGITKDIKFIFTKYEGYEKEETVVKEIEILSKKIEVIQKEEKFERFLDF